MREIRVNHGGLDGIVEILRGGISGIDARLDALEAELAPLRSDWSGHAQRAYGEAKQTWDTAVQEVLVLLEQTRGAVAQSNAQYAAADLRGAGLFGA